MKKTSILIISIIIGLVILVSLSYLFYVSGFGKCQLGNKLADNKTCVKIGSKIDTGSEKYLSLKITRTYWNGWAQRKSESQTQINVTTYILNESLKEIDLKGISTGDNNLLEIISKTNDSVTFRINGLALKQGDELKKSGTDLTDCKNTHTFTMKKGDKVELDTCSMDVGVNWDLELN